MGTREGAEERRSARLSGGASLPLVLSSLLVAACGRFGDAEPAASDGGTSGDGSGAGVVDAAVLDGGGGGDAATRCTPSTDTLYCEDFTAPDDVDGVIAASGSPIGFFTTQGNGSFAIVGPRDPSRALSVSVTAGSVLVDTQIQLLYPKAPPQRVRFKTRVKFGDSIADLDLLAFGFVRSDDTRVFLYATFSGGQIRLAEYDTRIAQEFGGEGLLSVAPGSEEEVRLDIDRTAVTARLFVGGSLASTRNMTQMAGEFPGYRIHYGLYGDKPRPAVSVTYDDVEVRSY